MISLHKDRTILSNSPPLSGKMSLFLRADFREGDEDSDFSLSRVRRTSSLNCLSCRNPYQAPRSLNCLPPFHWKTLFFTMKSKAISGNLNLFLCSLPFFSCKIQGNKGKKGKMCRKRFRLPDFALSASSNPLPKNRLRFLHWIFHYFLQIFGGLVLLNCT